MALNLPVSQSRTPGLVDLKYSEAVGQVGGASRPAIDALQSRHELRAGDVALRAELAATRRARLRARRARAEA